METVSKSKKLPAIDSIEALATFWDSHDVTDFAEELEEITTPVFVRQTDTAVQFELPTKELEAVKRIAQEQETDPVTLMREWVLEKLYYAEMMRRVIKEFQTQ